jgi:hypothetical protein
MSDPRDLSPVGGPPPTSRRLRTPPPLRRPSTRRLFWVCTIGTLSLLMLQSLLAPVGVGWRRAEEALAFQDELDYLQRRHVSLREEIEYRKTPAGQALTTAEVLVLTYPRGRVVELVPRPDARRAPPPTFGERVKGWREKGRTCLHCKWRVANLLFFGRRLPPERPS